MDIARTRYCTRQHAVSRAAALRVLSAAYAATLVGVPPLALSEPLGQEARRTAATAPGPPLPSPEQTGTLTQTETNALYAIIWYVGEKWGIAAYSGLPLPVFTHYVALKTTRIPSYYTVYRTTLQLFGDLSARLGRRGALEYLYTPAPMNPPPEFPVVRAWVIQEFCTLFVTTGAFRAYGWVNYPGWFGGRYNDPRRLPYRPWNRGRAGQRRYRHAV